MGFSQFNFDAETNSLSVYFAVCTSSNFHPPGTGLTSSFRVSNVDGLWDVPPVDGRVQYSFPTNPEAHAVFVAANSIPVDYSYLFHDEAEICDKERFAILAEEAAEKDLLDFFYNELPHPVSPGKTVQMMDRSVTVPQSLEHVWHMTEVLDCAVGFLRGGPDTGANGYNLIEAAIFIHFLNEISPKTRLPAVHGWS